MSSTAAVGDPASPTASEEASAVTPTTGSTGWSRSSLVESFRSCGLPGARVNKEDLCRRIRITRRLSAAVAEAVLSRGNTSCPAAAAEGEEDEWPEAPVVVFVNTKSGGRHGPVLKERLQQLMGADQVFDLSVVKPSDFVQYGLGCLETLASLGDLCAKITRERLRIMVAGGDGTVGWVLGSLQELYVQNREPVPPIGIIPLGTGNDLSRSFGWGGSFPFGWRSAVKRSLYKAATNSVYSLDSWHVTISMPAGQEVELPHSLRHPEVSIFGQDEDIEGELWKNYSFSGGVFYNYFSIGMDAQVAYSFHHLRDEKPHLASGPITNKLIYSGYICGQGWFFTPCIGDPGLRGLKHILRIDVRKVNCTEWEKVHVPKSVRAVVALNLHNYASGRNPWGNLKPEYLEKRGFVEANVNDGLLEIFGLKQGWHASLVMVELISAKHIAQAEAIRLEIRGGQWKQVYMQTDGEPWKQPLSKEFSTFIEIKRVPFQSLMISGE